MCPCKGVYRWILRKRLLQHFSNHWEKASFTVCNAYCLNQKTLRDTLILYLCERMGLRRKQTCSQMFIVVRWFFCVQLTIKWVLFHFYLKNIVDLISLKSILINRKPISQFNQHLSLFWKSCMEKSQALSHWMIPKIWFVGYDLTQFVRSIVQLSVQAQLFSCILSLIK